MFGKYHTMILVWLDNINTDHSVQRGRCTCVHKDRYSRIPGIWESIRWYRYNKDISANIHKSMRRNNRNITDCIMSDMSLQLALIVVKENVFLIKRYFWI